MKTLTRYSIALFTIAGTHAVYAAQTPQPAETPQPVPLITPTPKKPGLDIELFTRSNPELARHLQKIMQDIATLKKSLEQVLPHIQSMPLSAALAPYLASLQNAPTLLQTYVTGISLLLQGVNPLPQSLAQQVQQQIATSLHLPNPLQGALPTTPLQSQIEGTARLLQPALRKAESMLPGAQNTPNRRATSTGERLTIQGGPSWNQPQEQGQSNSQGSKVRRYTPQPNAPQKKAAE